MSFRHVTDRPTVKDRRAFFFSPLLFTPFFFFFAFHRPEGERKKRKRTLHPFKKITILALFLLSFSFFSSSVFSLSLQIYVSFFSSSSSSVFSFSVANVSPLPPLFFCFFLSERKKKERNAGRSFFALSSISDVQ